MQREGGFTLVESLLVLFCISIVLIVTFPIFVVRLDHSLYEQAIQKFYITMYEAQYLAKTHNARTMITIEDSNKVTVTIERKGVASEWELPNGMMIHLDKLNNAISYTERGTISKFGTIVVETPDWEREYSINITYGRMREK